MLAEDVAVAHVHELSVGIRLAGVLLDEVGILARRHEADVLALVLLRIPEPGLFRLDARVVLAHGAEREADAGELLLRQVEEHIALVLLEERRLLQFPAAGLVIVFDPRIVSGDDEFAVERIRLAEELLELEIPVAIDAGVRRAAVLIGLHEGVHDGLFELRLEVHDVVRDVHLETDQNGIRHIVVGAAGLVRPHLGVFVVEEAHGDTDTVIARALHEKRRGGRVHSPAHRNQRSAHSATSFAALLHQFQAFLYRKDPK